MRITFLGAARTVTGSCFLVETEKTKFIVDCGLFQGGAEERKLNTEPFKFNINEIDFALLSHAHIDHSGRIPKLYADGFKKNIYTTKATAELCSIMLPDSGSIQESETEWQNRKNIRAGRKSVNPLYTMQDAYNSLSLFKTIPYGKIFSPLHDVKVLFRDAGHILGSAIIEVWIKEGNEEVKYVFSGDLGNKGVPIIRDPEIIDSTDYLILESTYGDRNHTENADKVERFLQIIDETVKEGGNVIIPSFSIGRTQELIYELNKHKEHYPVKIDNVMNIPVYIDSPLAVSATHIFRENIDCYDEEAREYILSGDNPLDFPKLYFTSSVDESKWLNIDKGSKIIISASGMCDAGRIKHHLKHNLWRRESTVLFVGYQAKGSLGRRLLDGAKRVRIYGEDITVNARIEMLDGYSGHADREGLLDWIRSMKYKPGKIYLTHGEHYAIYSLSEAIEAEYGISTYIPEYAESITIGKEPAAAPSIKQPKKLDNKTTAALIDSLEGEIQVAMDALRSELKMVVNEKELENVARKVKSIGKHLRILTRA